MNTHPPNTASNPTEPLLPVVSPTVKTPQSPLRYRSSVFQHPPWEGKRRILFICHDATPYGAQKSLELMVRNLPADAYHCFVSFGRPGRLEDSLGHLPHVTVLHHQRMMWVKHSQRSALKKLGDQLSVVLNANRLFPLLETCQQFNIDLIHSNSLVSVEGALVAKILGIPHVWHVREWFEEYNPRFQLTFGDTLTKKLVHHLSDRVVCVSNVVRQQFEPWVSQTPDRYTVLYNAVDTQQFAMPAYRPDPEKPLSLAYIGRVSDGKRFGDIIDALVQAKTFYPKFPTQFPFQLHVYGEFIDPRFKSWVEQRLAQHQLSPFVHFHGYCDHLSDALAQTDLLILPSTNESFGRSVIEAMACGIPVLVARSGGPTELIQPGHHGYFFNPKDPHHLAEQLVFAEAHREELAQMRPNARARVEKVFDIPVQQWHLRSLYDQLLAKRQVL